EQSIQVHSHQEVEADVSTNHHHLKSSSSDGRTGRAGPRAARQGSGPGRIPGSANRAAPAKTEPDGQPDERHPGSGRKPAQGNGIVAPGFAAEETGSAPV